mmetsp:Transcript_14784/g.36894  ORF Transcript_14784/g.36894 Transcript_14784/m.36894 type:complete len:301 (-) Transcript_14784:34-936(-)
MSRSGGHEGDLLLPEAHEAAIRVLRPIHRERHIVARVDDGVEVIEGHHILVHVHATDGVQRTHAVQVCSERSRNEAIESLGVIVSAVAGQERACGAVVHVVKSILRRNRPNEDVRGRVRFACRVHDPGHASRCVGRARLVGVPLGGGDSDEERLDAVVEPQCAHGDGDAREDRARGRPEDGAALQARLLEVLHARHLSVRAGHLPLECVHTAPEDADEHPHDREGVPRVVVVHDAPQRDEQLGDAPQHHERRRGHRPLQDGREEAHEEPRGATENDRHRARRVEGVDELAHPRGGEQYTQ